MKTEYLPRNLGNVVLVDPPIEGLEALNYSELDQRIKVVKLPLSVSEETLRKISAEMHNLQEERYLTTLRGGILTDLARKLETRTAAYVRKNCATLTDFVLMFEEFLSQLNSFLRIRTFKYDIARLSSTNTEGKENMHLDYMSASRDEQPGPIYQIFINLGLSPRQFKYIPYTFSQIIEKLVSEGVYTAREVNSIAAESILWSFEKFKPTRHMVSIPSLHAALFDGRNFPHDACKGNLQSILKGEFLPSSEADMVMVLDSKERLSADGYNPEISFLDDVW